MQMMGGFGGIRDGIRRRVPVVTTWLNFPRLRLASLKACVGAGIRRTTKADLIPSPGMRVVAFERILHEELPEAARRTFLPDNRAGCGLFIVDRLKTISCWC